jgi:hypothetical protein
VCIAIFYQLLIFLRGEGINWECEGKKVALLEVLIDFVIPLVYILWDNEEKYRDKNHLLTYMVYTLFYTSVNLFVKIAGFLIK